MNLDIETRIDLRLIAEAEGAMHYKGEIFKVGGGLAAGVRDLYNPDTGDYVGTINPEDGTINVWGHGEPESKHAERKGKRSIPKQTGWEITWEDPSGAKTGRFYPLDFPQARLDAIIQSLKGRGAGPQLKPARGKSRWPSVGEYGVTALKQPETTASATKSARPKPEKVEPLVVTQAQYDALANKPGFSPEGLSQLLKSGQITIRDS